MLLFRLYQNKKKYQFVLWKEKRYARLLSEPIVLPIFSPVTTVLGRLRHCTSVFFFYKLRFMLLVTAVQESTSLSLSF